MYQYCFGALGLIGNSCNAYTIAPKMVLFKLKFALHQSRGCTSIIFDANTFSKMTRFCVFTRCRTRIRTEFSNVNAIKKQFEFIVGVIGILIYLMKK